MIDILDVEEAIRNRTDWITVTYLIDQLERRGIIVSRVAMRDKWAEVHGIRTRYTPVFVAPPTTRQVMRDSEDW